MDSVYPPALHDWPSECRLGLFSLPPHGENLPESMAYRQKGQRRRPQVLRTLSPWIQPRLHWAQSIPRTGLPSCPGTPSLAELAWDMIDRSSLMSSVMSSMYLWYNEMRMVLWGSKGIEGEVFRLWDTSETLLEHFKEPQEHNWSITQPPTKEWNKTLRLLVLQVFKNMTEPTNHSLYSINFCQVLTTHSPPVSKYYKVYRKKKCPSSNQTLIP